MNRRDQSCDDFVAKVRELLTDNAQDVIGQMENAAAEMLGPEEHECRLEHYANLYSSDGGNWKLELRCPGCAKIEVVEIDDLVREHNAMRHLDAELLESAAYWLRKDAIEGSLAWMKADRADAAAAALRK